MVGSDGLAVRLDITRKTMAIMTYVEGRADEYQKINSITEAYLNYVEQHLPEE
jgi:hypothetical protein